MFSPIVRAPLTRWLSSRSRGESAEYWVISCAERASNASRSSGVHHETRFPSPSYFEPWSSKPWPTSWPMTAPIRSEEHTSELQSRFDLVCRLLLEKKKQNM